MCPNYMQKPNGVTSVYEFILMQKLHTPVKNIDGYLVFNGCERSDK